MFDLTGLICSGVAVRPPSQSGQVPVVGDGGATAERRECMCPSAALGSLRRLLESVTCGGVAIRVRPPQE